MPRHPRRCGLHPVRALHDVAGPGEPLAEALPQAKLKVLRNTDHFATPESFAFIDAALEFLDAVPA